MSFNKLQLNKQKVTNPAMILLSLVMAAILLLSKCKCYIHCTYTALLEKKQRTRRTAYLTILAKLLIGSV